MDKLHNLIFRACKSEGYIRLCSIRKRFYMVSGEDDQHIVSMLQDVCQKYNLINDYKLREMLSKLNPDHWQYNKELSYLGNLIERYIEIIRFSKVGSIEGYVSPAIFRNGKQFLFSSIKYLTIPNKSV